MVTQRHSVPDTLGVRGARLWRELTSWHEFGPAHLAIVEEACRLADRLDRLHGLLAGDTAAWATLNLDETGTEVTVVVSSVLTEARLHATALRGLVTELRQASRGEEAPAGGGADPVAALVDEVAAKRGQRGRGA